MTDTPLLRVTGLSKIFGEVPVLDRVDLTVRKGEIVMIVGPSGAGKSTLLRCINRIETPSEGVVLIGDTNMGGQMKGGILVPDTPMVTARKRRRVGMVFQRFNLFGHLSALDNVAIGPRRVLGVKALMRGHGPTRNSRGSACLLTQPRSRRSFPAASSSGSRLPGPWPCSRR